MKHVKAVANLLIIQGAGELGLGLMSLFASVALSARAENPSGRATVFFFVIAAGVVLVFCGGLKVVAGIRNRRLRNRMLGYIALLSALPAVIGTWCAPTGLAIMLYGLVIYSRTDVAEAFDRSDVGPTGGSLGLLS